MIDQESKFHRIGKELPYQVPNDFFERLPEKTLQLAKQRVEKRRRSQNVIRFFAAMSVAAAVLFVFLLAPQRDLKTEHQLVALLKDTSTIPLEKKSITTEHQAGTLKAKRTVVENKTTAFALDDEKVEELLTSLSDEDLLLLTAMYTAEDLEGESTPENININ